MYSTLSLKRLLTLVLPPPFAIFILFVAATHTPQSVKEAWSVAGKVIGWWGLAIVVLGSGTQWWAPWRLIWRVPGVQRYLFPDLNGVWTGATKSNWPSVKAMVDAYEATEPPRYAGPLDEVALQADAIEIRITASFFRFRIQAKLSNTKGSSHSVSARVEWNDHLERYEIYYLYTQATPTPLRTDEATHLGAASLILDMDKSTLSGEYWTRRSWRSGMNTAGLIEVARASS